MTPVVQSALWNPADYSGTLYKRGAAWWQLCFDAIGVMPSSHGVYCACANALGHDLFLQHLVLAGR